MKFQDSNPQWKSELADTVLNPRIYTEVEMRAINNVKHAVGTLKFAQEKAPHLLPGGIVEATHKIESLLDIFQN